MAQGDRHPDAAIAREAYDGAAQHVFLTGDLRKPSDTPYFHDPRVEMVVCDYAAGDDGTFHWHADITEYQMLLSGRVGLKEAATGQTSWYGHSDVVYIPAGVCVQRLVPEPSRMLGLKVPSIPGDKIHCPACRRV